MRQESWRVLSRGRGESGLSSAVFSGVWVGRDYRGARVGTVGWLERVEVVRR